MTDDERLLDQTLADDLAEEWQQVQARFVDDHERRGPRAHGSPQGARG
jgi:hypothetical protein